MSRCCVICPHMASRHNRPQERRGEQECVDKDFFWRAETGAIYFPQTEEEIMTEEGAQRTHVLSFYASIFARVRRNAESAKTHRDMLDSCKMVLKANMHLNSINCSRIRYRWGSAANKGFTDSCCYLEPDV